MKGSPHFCATRRLLWLAVAFYLLPVPAPAQVNYVARFTLDKSPVVAGEPVFCTFSIQNTGAQPFAFAYRNPMRIANSELESEPNFVVRDAAGRRVADPAPRRCGGAKGTAVYGSVSLPPGQIHTERWLLNQWARFARAGKYRVHAERRLPLLGIDEARREFTGSPVAFAAALNEFTVEVAVPTEAKLRSAFEPYEKVLRKPEAKGFPESVEAVVTLPQPFLLDELVMLASAGPNERRWDRERALEGLARLGTPEAWEAILKIARGSDAPVQGAPPETAAKQDSLRAFAILLLAERGDRRDLASILAMLSGAPDSLRGDMIRALGFFRDPRANQALFDRLHSPAPADRVNAILGLRNLEDKNVVPALIAMLNDPEAQVRQVAHFALRNLTGQAIQLSPTASAGEAVGVARSWRAWWQKQGADYRPLRQPPCRDW
ncbi:MAG: HEAT repeat domain-containing protein [Acidobacteria bacterium]|nr:HEAT repeat domain-containing protein [Acidobacteriota bacterium]